MAKWPKACRIRTLMCGCVALGKSSPFWGCFLLLSPGK